MYFYVFSFLVVRQSLYEFREFCRLMKALLHMLGKLHAKVHYKIYIAYYMNNKTCVEGKTRL